MAESSIRTEFNDGIATLTFDQPNSRANVLSTSLWIEFGKALDALTHRNDVAGLIIASAKPGIFIAGADLKELEAGDEGGVRTFIELGLRVLETLESLPLPTGAVIDGAALGGGLEVALACDFRTCGDNPKLQLGLPEVKLGLCPGWGGTQRLPRLVGVEEAIERLISGESYEANDPAPDDLVDASVTSDELAAATLKIVRECDWKVIREVKRSAVPSDLHPSPEFLADLRETFNELDESQKPAASEILRLVLQGSLSELAAGIRMETDAFVRLATSDNAKRMIKEFFAKRKK